MNSSTGEIRDFLTAKLARDSGFDIPLTEAQAHAFEKLTPAERVETVRAVRAACGSACPSIKARFKVRKDRKR